MSGTMSQSSTLSPAQVRAAILASAVPVAQPIGAPITISSPTAGVPQIVTFQPRNVGLLRRLLVEVKVTLTAGAAALAVAPFGPANLLSNITLTDLNNLQRINTSGRHLTMVNIAKRRRVSGASYASDSPLGYAAPVAGSPFNPIYAPATIAAAAQKTISMIYEIPVSYHDQDLRGSIFLGTTQASVSVALTINPSLVAAFSGDPTNAVYIAANGAATPYATVNSISVQPYQYYLDQLPVDKSGAPLLPLSDMSAIYQLSEATVNGMVANSEFTIPYANMRSFLSTTAIFDNGGTLNPGSDVSYWALQSANLYNFWRKSPDILAYETANELGDCMPSGAYYFPSRKQPINTQQFGNTNLVLNATTVNSNASVIVGYEFFANSLTLASGGSLPAA
jgi:hypothetical protein